MKITFYNFCVFVIKPLMKFFFPYEVKGKENLKGLSDGYILCSNHLSLLDPVFLMIIHPKPISFMAKAELFRNNFLKKLFLSLGAFPVERGKGDKSAINYAVEIPLKGGILGIFIEGTRSKTGDFLRPRSGAAILASKTKATVVPVCITGTFKNNKIHLFKKTTISYGKPVERDKINISGSNRTEIKEATNLIMSNIKELRGVKN